MSIWIPLLSALASAIIAVTASWLTLRLALKRFQAEFAMEQSAEAAIHQLLALDKFPYRSFPMIHLTSAGSNPTNYDVCWSEQGRLGSLRPMELSFGH